MFDVANWSPLEIACRDREVTYSVLAFSQSRAVWITEKTEGEGVGKTIGTYQRSKTYNTKSRFISALLVLIYLNLHNVYIKHQGREIVILERRRKTQNFP